MTRNVKRDETLCSNNLSVKDNLTRLRARLKKLGVTDSEVYSIINDSRDTLRVMKSQGQSLEDRCYKYFQCITSLGFKRIRKTNKKFLNK